jgi:uncharacterized protein with PIN domain
MGKLDKLTAKAKELNEKRIEHNRRQSELRRQRIAQEEAARQARLEELGPREVARQDALAKSGRKKFSAVADQGRCPRCGGAAFKAKRSKKGKVSAGLLAPKTQVKCTTCGTMYKRG